MRTPAGGWWGGEASDREGADGAPISGGLKPQNRPSSSVALANRAHVGDRCVDNPSHIELQRSRDLPDHRAGDRLLRDGPRFDRRLARDRPLGWYRLIIRARARNSRRRALASSWGLAEATSGCRASLPYGLRGKVGFGSVDSSVSSASGRPITLERAAGSTSRRRSSCTLPRTSSLGRARSCFTSCPTGSIQLREQGHETGLESVWAVGSAGRAIGDTRPARNVGRQGIGSGAPSGGGKRPSLSLISWSWRAC